MAAYGPYIAGTVEFHHKKFGPNQVLTKKYLADNYCWLQNFAVKMPEFTLRRLKQELYKAICKENIKPLERDVAKALAYFWPTIFPKIEDLCKHISKGEYNADPKNMKRRVSNALKKLEAKGIIWIFGASSAYKRNASVANLYAFTLQKFRFLRIEKLREDIQIFFDRSKPKKSSFKPFLIAQKQYGGGTKNVTPKNPKTTTNTNHINTPISLESTVSKMNQEILEDKEWKEFRSECIKKLPNLKLNTVDKTILDMVKNNLPCDVAKERLKNFSEVPYLKQTTFSLKRLITYKKAIIDSYWTMTRVKKILQSGQRDLTTLDPKEFYCNSLEELEEWTEISLGTSKTSQSIPDETQEMFRAGLADQTEVDEEKIYTIPDMQRQEIKSNLPEKSEPSSSSDISISEALQVKPVDLSNLLTKLCHKKLDPNDFGRSIVNNLVATKIIGPKFYPLLKNLPYHQIVDKKSAIRSLREAVENAA